MAWDHKSVDYRYRPGTVFHTQELYDFPDTPATIPTGFSVDLVVDHPPLHSPATPNNYTSNWMLKISDIRFCELYIKIKVQ